MAIKLLPASIPACMDPVLNSVPTSSPQSASKSKKKHHRRHQYVQVLDLSGKGSGKTYKRIRVRRKDPPYFTRNDFKLIRYLRAGDPERLDKLRDDLQASIERTVRIQQRFVKELTKHSSYSNRVKTIIKAVGEIPFHSDFQRKIIADGITEILESKDKAAEKKKKEEQEAHQKKKHDQCTCVDCLGW